jgi:hypothetical protein
MIGSPINRALSDALTALHLQSGETNFTLAPALEELAPKIMDGLPPTEAGRLNEIFSEAMKMHSLDEVAHFLQLAKAAV